MRKIDEYEVNILERTKRFGVEIIKASSKFPKTTSGFTISDQLVRAGTSVGSNLIEAQEAVSRNDFIYKVSFSLKEAKETKYWLEIVETSDLLPREAVKPLLSEVEEITKILVVTLKKLRAKK